MSRLLLTLVAACVVVLAGSAMAPAAADENEPDPEPIESTGASLIDVIKTSDPQVSASLKFIGRGPEDFFDKRKDKLTFQKDAFLYIAGFGDGAKVGFRVHPEFKSAAKARKQVKRLLRPISQLPKILRRRIERIAILKGDETAQGGGDGEGIHFHSGNVGLRIRQGQLEETVFHESVHTSVDGRWADSPEWRAAQQADGRFLTTYGRENPGREDLAETALYAFGLLRHPTRFTEAQREEWAARVPNRIRIIKRIFSRRGLEIVRCDDARAERATANRRRKKIRDTHQRLKKRRSVNADLTRAKQKIAEHC